VIERPRPTRRRLYRRLRRLHSADSRAPARADPQGLSRSRREYQGEHAVLQPPRRHHVNHGRLQAARQLPLLAVQRGVGRELRRRHGPVWQAHVRQRPAVRHVTEDVSAQGDGAQRSQRQADAAQAGLATGTHLPDDLTALLAQKEHIAARKTCAGFGPGAKREYMDWISEAKTDATRQERIAITLEYLNEGKQRNWKYQKC
jgi:hypothetical protein